MIAISQASAATQQVNAKKHHSPNNSASEASATIAERRSHRRIDTRLPVEIRREGAADGAIVRTLTQNVSAGGLYLETDSAEFRPGDRLRVELTVPAAEGVSCYPAKAACIAEVIRMQPLAHPGDHATERFAIAARFLDRLRISI